MLLTAKMFSLSRKTGEYVSVPMPETFAYRLDEPNFLVLDNAEFFVEGKGQGRDYVLNIDRKLRSGFGLEIRNGEMVQPWFRKKYENFRKKYCRLSLAFRFICEYLPVGAALMTGKIRESRTPSERCFCARDF